MRLLVLLFVLASQPVLAQTTATNATQVDAAAVARIATGRIHLVVVADTNDDVIGKSVAADLKNITSMFADQVPKHQLRTTSLTRKEVRRSTILNTISALRINPELDTVVFYFCGHGVYDPNSKQHLFVGQGQGDVFLRSEIQAAIQQLQPRLTVLIGDTCSVFLQSKSTGIPPAVKRSTRLFRALFFEPVGLVDINSTEPDEVARGNFDGGYFTHELCSYLNAKQAERLSWETVLKDVGDGVTHYPDAAQTAYALSPLPELPGVGLSLPESEEKNSNQTISDQASKAFDVADYYAAVARSELTGRYGSGYGYRSRDEAEQAALKNVNADDARVVGWCRNSWLAFANEKLTGAWGHAWANTEEEATRKALENCNQHALGRSRIQFCVYAHHKALAPATLRIEVPSENTILFLNGQRTGQTGLVRSFTTPKIEPGKKRRYTITIQQPVDTNRGVSVDRTVEADVAAGLLTIVSFDTDSVPRIRTIHPLEDPLSVPQKDAPLTQIGGQPANRIRFGAHVQNSRSGVQVTGVLANSPAMRCKDAGGKNWYLEAGDVITRVNGQPVQTEFEYRAAIQASPASMQITVIGAKDRKRYEFSVQLND